MKKKNLNPWSKILYLFVTFAFFVTVDWYFSDLIVEKLIAGETIKNDLIHLNYVQNTGAAFSIMQDSTILLIIFSLAALIILFTYIIKYAKTMTMIGIFWLSLLMSGIFCNLIERVHFGYVRDYFELIPINFPVFNISDVFINIGVLAVIILLLKRTQIRQL
jgi:signal peptidase II